jgi:hypothetical protein
MTTRRWMFVIACGALGACAGDDAAPAAAPTARELFDQGNTFLVDVAQSSTLVRTSVTENYSGNLYAIDAPVAGGVFVGMLEDGNVVLDDLTVTLDEFALQPIIGVLGGDQVIVDLELRGAGAQRFLDTVWSEDGGVAMTPQAGGLLELRWGVRVPGHRGTYRYDRTVMVEATVMVLSDEDAVEVLITGGTTKFAWVWEDRTYSTELDLSLEASIPRE